MDVQHADQEVEGGQEEEVNGNGEVVLQVQPRQVEAQRVEEEEELISLVERVNPTIRAQ